MRAVIDTGVFISAFIRNRGTIGAVLGALRDGHFTAIYSTDTLVELVDVLGRERFRTKYHIEPDDITALVNLIRLRGELVIPNEKVTACRDPKDDKFLEAALASDADCLVSGDSDLLEMISFDDIPILRPSDFLTRLREE
jgi:putative PIN family toxin of toxin-antitoxin system